MDTQDALMFETSRSQSATQKQKLASPHASPYRRLPLRDSSSSNWSSTDESTTAWDLEMDEANPIRYKSLEEVCERTKARMSVNARMGLPATFSGSGLSVASSTSTSSFDPALDDEADLSGSFESTNSFFPLTPARTLAEPRGQMQHVPTAAACAMANSENASPGARHLDEQRRDSLGYSPRSDLRSMIYRSSGQPLASPKAIVHRGTLGQSLGLITTPARVDISPSARGLSNAPGHSSPLSGRAELAPNSDSYTVVEESIASSSSSPSIFATPPSTNLAARRKLPPLAIHGGQQGTRSMMPQTPGGSLFPGARDGAATGGQTPVSPFLPPTPLVAASHHAYRHGERPPTATTYPSDKKRGSLPNIHAPLSCRSPMQRQGSLGPMSPLSRDFANVSMHATPPPAASVCSQDSAWSASTTLTTPPFSPLGVNKPLTPSDLADDESMASTKGVFPSSSGLSVAGDDSGRSKKRIKDDALPTMHREEGTLGASRPKMTKSKSATRSSPYPSKEVALTTSPRNKLEPSPAKLSSSSDRLPSPLLSPSSSLSPASAKMEKSLTAPPQPMSAEPKTVSAQHLSKRVLHPGFAAAYTLSDELGSGGFGFVVSATRNFDGMPVAVKFIWKDKVPSHGWVQDPALGVIPLEAFVLRVVDHPCVVKFVELFDDEEFFYLVMEMHGTPWKAPDSESEVAATATTSEKSAVSPSSKPLQPSASPKVAVYAPDSSRPIEASILPASSSPITSEADGSLDGSLSRSSQDGLTPPPRPAPMERRTSRDLFECIEQHTRFPEDRAAWVFAQIVEAVYFLDKLGICHRDIKDENCVIDSDWNVKLIDFGSAVISDPRKPPPYFNRFFGTMTFASAEILEGQQYRAPHAEVWSLGVLLSILLSGECPFSDPDAAKKGRISSRVRKSWSPEALNLLMGCVNVDPDRRATISQVREHPWVRRAWETRGLERPAAPRIF
ncbi:unnamed protein product [Parajaminaea phylloscopi]